MATRTILIDDLDGGPANVTIAFTIDGETYSLDLSNKNADKFWTALGPYIEAASGSRNERLQQVHEYRAEVEQRKAIRDWARKQGYSVAERGKIPVDIQEAFDQAHGH